MRRCLMLAVSIVAVPFAGAAVAQTVASSVADQATEVDEVVVTAAPYRVSLDSVATSVNVIDRERLDVAPPAGLGDTLNGLPGLRSTNYGPGASRPVIRGLSGPRVLVLQNGVGLVDASALSPDHAVASDPGAADRIEVLRGPSTLAYGGSAIGGVVNVIDDRIPSEIPEDGFDGHASTSYETVDEGVAASAHLRAGSGSWVIALDAASRRSDDYSVPTAPVSPRLAAVLGVDRGDEAAVPNSDVSADAYGAGISYVGDSGFVGLSLTRTETEYGVPFAPAVAAAMDDDEGPIGLDLEQTRLDLRGEYRFAGDGPFERVRLSAGFADYEHVEILRAANEVGTRFLSDGGEARVELVQRERGDWQGAIGVQALSRAFDAIGDEAFVPATDIREAGVFALQRYDRGDWGVEGGLRLDRRELRSDVAERDFTNGSASAAVFVRPTQGWFLSVAAAHNRRAPTEFELFADGPHPGTGAFELGDATLNSESVVSLEGTVRYRGERARIEGHLFVASYRDYIEQAPTGAIEDGLPVFRYFATDADFVGGELSGAYDLWRDGARRLTLEGAVDVVRGETDEGDVARIPPYSATARLAYVDDRWTLRAEARRVGDQDRVATFELPTDGYTLVSAFASHTLAREPRVRLFLDARNLTDEEAREHVSFLKDIAPLPGRSVRAGVALSF